MIRLAGPIALMLLCSLGGRSLAEEFTVRLRLRNAHLLEVYFGCAEKATAGYDRNLDDFSPPPGIETGYVGFVSGIPNLPLFYRDIRSTAGEQTWRFQARVYEDQAIEISWDPAALPAAWGLSLTTTTGTVDMKRSAKVSLAESQVVVIRARKTPRTPAEKPSEVTNE